MERELWGMRSYAVAGFNRHDFNPSPFFYYRPSAVYVQILLYLTLGRKKLRKLDRLGDKTEAAFKRYAAQKFRQMSVMACENRGVNTLAIRYFIDCTALERGVGRMMAVCTVARYSKFNKQTNMTYHDESFLQMHDQQYPDVCKAQAATLLYARCLR